MGKCEEEGEDEGEEEKGGKEEEEEGEEEKGGKEEETRARKSG